MDVYIDVLLLENIVINYLILFITSKLVKQQTTSLRMLAGACLGAVYACLIVLLPDIGIYFSLPAKILLSFEMIAVSFRLPGFKALFRILVIFYAVTMVFAGTTFAFIYFNSADSGLIGSGIFHIPSSSMGTIFLGIIFAIIILRTLREILGKRLSREKMLVSLRIRFENQQIDIRALVDTGNHLMDPLSNLPVIVVEYRALEDVLPEEIRRVFNDSKEEDLDTVSSVISQSVWMSRFRLIPFSSIGRENGMMIGFKPDYVEIGEKTNHIANNAIIGICKRVLSRNDSYMALIGSELV